MEAKVTVHYTTANVASRNMGEALKEMGFPFLKEWDCHVLEIEPVEGYNIILSPHRAKSGIPALTAHTPGNWTRADFGGEPYKLSVAWPSFLLTFMEVLNSILPAEEREGLDVVYEVDHHGPSADVPTVFVELGSNEEQWEHRGRAEVMAEAVRESLEGLKKAEEVFVGIGGGHYAKKFTRKSLEEGWAFAHLLPKYQVDALGERLEEMLRHAVERSAEPVKGFVVEKKGLTGKQRERVKKALESIGMEWFYI